MKKTLVSLSALVVLASCSSSGGKKILVMSKGKADINKEAKTVTVEGGSSHEEKTVEFSDDGDLKLNVKSGTGNETVDVPSNGYYLLNAKTDTIIGTKQNYGAARSQAKTFSQDDVKHSIDSLQQLLDGKTTAGNYYILPGQAVKITDNLDATMVGPFNSLTTLEQSGDKTPEVYKFYTSKDIRETMDRLQKMTIAPPSPNQ